MTTLSDAVVAKIQAAPVNRVFKMGEVTGKPGYPYLSAAVTFDQAEAYRSDATHGVAAFRVTTQSFGSDYEAATDTDARARRALLDQRITVDGVTYGPGVLQVGAAIVRDPDGGAVITVTSTYLFRSEE